MSADVLCGEMESAEEDNSKNALCKICKKEYRPENTE